MSEPPFVLDPDAEREIVDQIAMVFERAGMPPSAGRILGRLLMCDPPQQSSQQLADYTGSSAGGISQACRMLEQIGLVERVRLRGERAVYFRAREGCWTVLLHEEMQRTRFVRGLADRALVLMAEATPETRRRMQEFRDFYSFFENEIPSLLERWEQRRKV